MVYALSLVPSDKPLVRANVSACKQIPITAVNAALNAHPASIAAMDNASAHLVKLSVQGCASICKQIPITAANATLNAHPAKSVPTVSVLSSVVPAKQTAPVLVSIC
jgi:hypothetical protein